MRRLVLVGAAFVTFSATGLGSAMADPVPREVALNSNGVGVCVSQVALQPELFQVEHLGQFVSSIDPGTGPEVLEAARSPECGYPPGPGHLAGG